MTLEEKNSDRTKKTRKKGIQEDDLQIIKHY
jgi:hypothetical protein